MSKPVKFELAAGFTALRLAVGGGREVAIDGRGSHSTDDPDAIAALDAHPAAKRAPAKKAASRKPKAAAVTPTEEKST